MTFRAVSFLLLVFLTSACVSVSDYLKADDYTRNRASFDFDCSPDEVDVKKVGQLSFAASGCDSKGIYECKHEGPWYGKVMRCQKAE